MSETIHHYQYDDIWLFGLKTINVALNLNKNNDENDFIDILYADIDIIYATIIDQKPLFSCLQPIEGH